MIDAVAAKEPFSLKSALEWFRYKIDFNVSHPTYFNPDGLVCFVGAQGTGKTLSAVNYVYKLMEMYPKAKLVTNLMLKDYPIVTYDAWLKQFSIAVSNRYTAAQMEYWEHAYIDVYKRQEISYALIQRCLGYSRSDFSLIQLINSRLNVLIVSLLLIFFSAWIKSTLVIRLMEIFAMME